MLDLSGIVDDFAAPVTRRRYAAPVKVAGRATYAAPVEASILALVVPASGKTLDRLPEGLRGRARFVAYTSADVRTVDQAGNTKPDELDVDGEVFVCEDVEGWARQGNFRVVALVKVAA